MVWSSAQPHSVQDMVRRCFGEGGGNAGGVEGMGGPSISRASINGEDEFSGKREGGLLAVWARDTLGLDRNSYRESFFQSLVTLPFRCIRVSPSCIPRTHFLTH